MTEIDGLSMWDSPAQEVTLDRTLKTKALAEAAVEPLWPYLSKAASLPEFHNRLALSDHSIDRLLHEAVILDYGQPVDEIRVIANEHLTRRFTEALKAKEAEAEREAVAATLRDALAADSGQCTYDSGSMYGNTHRCTNKATHVVTYHNGSGPASKAPVCDRHLNAMMGRYPFDSTTSEKIATRHTAGETVQVMAYPPCDVCKMDGVNAEAHYDGKTVFGPWAHMCDGHFKTVGVGLGTGKGQKLVLAPGSKSSAKHQCEHAGDHHSGDVTAIYHGRTEPTYLCGYHASQVDDLSNFPRRKTAADIGDTDWLYQRGYADALAGRPKYAGGPEYESGYQDGTVEASQSEPVSVGLNTPFPAVASKTAGYALVGPGGTNLWGMVYDTEEGAKAHLDEAQKMKGSSLVPKANAMLPGMAYVVTEPGPNGARPTDRKTTDRDEANRWAQELLARPDWSPFTSSKTADRNPPYYIEEHDGKYVVVNDEGKIKGTFDTKEQARQQQKALYANVPGAAQKAKEDHGDPKPKVSAVQALLEAEGMAVQAGVEQLVYKAPSADQDFSNEGPDEATINSLVGKYVRVVFYNEHGVATVYDSGRFITTPSGEVEWASDANDYTHPIDPDSIYSITRLEEPVEVGQPRLFAAKTAEYHYIRERDGKYEIWQKGTGKTLSTHDTREEAEAAFRAMMRSKHGGSLHEAVNVKCANCGDIINRADAYVRGGIVDNQHGRGDWGQQAYCPLCADALGLTKKALSEVEALLAEASDADVIEAEAMLEAAEAAFFTHPKADNQSAHPNQQLLNIQREREAEQDSRRRSDEYFAQHPDEERPETLSGPDAFPSRYRERALPNMSASLTAAHPDYPDGVPYVCPNCGYYRNAKECTHCEDRAKPQFRGPTPLDWIMHGLFPSGATASQHEGGQAGPLDRSAIWSILLSAYPGFGRMTHEETDPITTAAVDAWHASNETDMYRFIMKWIRDNGPKQSSRQAVNENAYGTERYQNLPPTPRPDWITDWGDEDTLADPETTQQGMNAYIRTDNPLADTLTTVRQAALKMAGDQHEEGDESDSIGCTVCGATPSYWDYGTGSDKSGGWYCKQHFPGGLPADRRTSSRRTAGETDAAEKPTTTKPRQVPKADHPNLVTVTEEIIPADPVAADPVAPPLDMADPGGVDPTVEMGSGDLGGASYAPDPMTPTVDQMVAARVASLTRQIIADNPEMSRDDARALAAQTVATFPQMVSVNR